LVASKISSGFPLRRGRGEGGGSSSDISRALHANCHAGVGESAAAVAAREAPSDALPRELRPIVDLGAGCGLRAGEIAGLAVEDVDWIRGVVHVRRQLKMVRNQMVYGPPKGGKERHVPLPESIKLCLAEHLRTVAPAAAIELPWHTPDGKPVTATLLLHRDGKVQGRSAVNAEWLRAVRRVGVPAGAGTGQHQLRHYYASALLHHGCSVQAVGEYWATRAPSSRWRPTAT
jgi:integrase